MSRQCNEDNGVNGIQIQAIRALADEIPLNDFGLPTGIYRTDLLPYHDYKPKSHSSSNGSLNGEPKVEEEQLLIEHDDVLSDVVLTEVPHEDKTYRIAGFPAIHLHQAFMPLQFDEGFPAFDNGQPFWERLEYEPADAYEAFQKYLQMSLGKPSSLDGVGDEEEYDGIDATGIRNISTLASELFPNAQLLQMIQRFQEYYHLYYWGMRSHSYDLYRVAQHRTMQEIRAVESQDDHYIQSRRLRHRLMQYMDNEEDFWDMMTPKTGIDMFKTLTQLERISAGLPAGGPGTNGNGVNNENGKPFEVQLRTVAQTNRRITNTSISDEGEVLDKALEDPNATEILQELIIRTGGY